jgi:hypothetical protein
MKTSLLLQLTFVLLALSLNAQQGSRIKGDIIVQLKPGHGIRGLLHPLSEMNGQPTGLSVVSELSTPLRIWLLQVDTAAVDDSEFLEQVRRHPQVQDAQFNHRVSMRETVPDDPGFAQQWQWVNTGQGGGTPDADVDADLAWDITTGGTTAAGQEIVVCVVEGANRNHPDLQGNLWFNLAELPDNGLDDDGNGYVDDYNGWNPVNQTDNIPSSGHGTTVSGMIGAKGNNNAIVSGINWNVKLMHVNVGSLTEANVIAAYTYPLVMRRRYNQSGGSQGAFVVATNSSWGIDNGDPAASPLWCAFYDSLGAEGILSCGSTSNNNVNIDLVGDLPTACPSDFLISVTATNRNDLRTFSGYGTTHVDLGAPGEQIVSLSLNGGPSNSSGTSFSSPLTAGIIGLLYSAPCGSLGYQALADPAGTALLVRDALFNGVDLKPNLLGEVKTGGRVNAFNSLQLLLQSCGPCPKPFAIEVSSVSDSSAILSWASSDSTLYTNLRWRAQGATTWTFLENVASPFSLNNLAACSFYEFQLEDICADTTSSYTSLASFKTDGCCEAPQHLAINSLSDSSAAFSWQPLLAATAYQAMLISSSGDTLLLSGIGEPALSLDSLLPCTDYSIQIQTVCDSSTLTDFGPSFSFTTKGCGTCTDASYCPSYSNDATEEWIALVSVGEIINATASEDGYGDYTGISTDLYTYQAYPIALSPGFSGFPFNEWFKAWIDYNQDGDFEDPLEEIFNAGTASATTVSGSFIVPGDALPGLTRLRVAMKWNMEPQGPCAQNFDYGEVEDYCVNILPGTPPNCAKPVFLDTLNATYTTAELWWTAVTDALLGYELRYRPAGTINWLSNSVDDTITALAQLQACKNYETQVRALCAGEESEWSDTLFFATPCYPLCEEIPAGLDTTQVDENSAKLIWQEVENAVNYRVRYKNAAATNWTQLLSGGPPAIQLSGLLACADYEFAVQAICEGDQLSEFSQETAFRTDCFSDAPELRTAQDFFKVYPNPFTGELFLEFKLDYSQAVSITLLDARGSAIAAINRTVEGGEHRIDLLKEGITAQSPGIYFVKFHTGKGYHAYKKVIRQ